MRSRTALASIRGGSAIGTPWVKILEEHREFRRLDRLGALAFDIRRGVLDEAVGQCRAPIGAGAALLLVPGHRLPVGCEYQEAAGIDFHAIAARLVGVEIEALRIIVLGRAGLDEDAVLAEDVGGAHDVVALSTHSEK